MPELLAVVAVIAIIISMLLPSMQMARENARRAICLSNQRQISLGSLSYAADQRSFLPLYHSWATHYVSDSSTNDNRPYLLDIAGRGSSSPEIYYCPSHRLLNATTPGIGWRANTASSLISYGPIGIWQQSTTVASWPKTYTSIPVNTSPTLTKQGNRPVKRTEIQPELALSTDSQISWYAGSWGLSFTYPGDGVWPEHPGYYAYYAYPHRENGGVVWAGSNTVFFDGSGRWGNTADIMDKKIPYPHGAKWIMHYKRGIYEGLVFW